MIANIVYDNLSYYMICDNDVIVEGYEGFIIQESEDGRYYVVYKEINDNGENLKKYVLPDNNLNMFFTLKEKFKNFFVQQEVLNELVEQVKYESKEEESLKEACDRVYSLPENYIKFVAMNITKNQFHQYTKERLKL